MFDVSQLGITAEPEDIQPDEYVAPAGAFDEPVQPGTYDAKMAKSAIKDFDTGKKVNIRPGTVTSKKNGKTYLSVEYATQVTSDKAKGRVVYGRTNTMPEKLIFQDVQAGREMANGFLDLLVAVGGTPKTASSESYLVALDDSVEAEAPLRINVNWSAYCNPSSKEYAGCGHQIRGAKNFPINPDGSINPRIKCPGVHGTDAPVLLARAEIKSVYPKKG